MDLGVRQIRTAGRGSGSIEVTLPAALRDLVGLPCRITLRDGSRPDIVLQPDLRRAHQTFAAVWQALAGALLPPDTNVPILPLGAFTFGLRPPAGDGQRAFLCWRDGLLLAAEPPHEPSVIARTISALVQALAGSLPIDPALVGSFGAACGTLVTGIPATTEAQEACDLAATALAAFQADPAEACTAGIASPAFWRYAAPKLAAIADLFALWTRDPALHATLSAAWRRGRTDGMDGGLAP